MADITEAIRRLIFEYVSEGAEKVMQTQEAVAASTTKTDKASLSLEKSFGNLERRYVATVRHQQDYAKVQEKVNAAVAQNPALQERANALLAAAGDHFDNLAFSATKGGAAATLFGKALQFILGPAGLMGAAMTAVGVAVGYMAAQFQSSSTTIEQALEEQNRLLKEAKALIDAKTSAEQKASAQSPAVTELQMLQNRLDLQIKLNKAIEEASRLAMSRAGTPTQVAGEMGEAPTGVGPAGGSAGYAQILAAVQALNAAWAQGQPGLVAYQTELAKIALAHPQLAATVQEMLKLGATGIQLEQAALKAKAIADAMAGIATNAQMAAVGLGSIAQFNLANLGAEQAAAATERMAVATLELSKLYPGMSVDVAKQLSTLEGTLKVAEARTGAEKIVATEIARQNQLLLEGKSLEEAVAIAAAERAVTEANISTAIHDQIHNLEQQVELSKARMNGTEQTVIAEQAYVNALRQGASELDAQALKQATLNNEIQKGVERASQLRSEYQGIVWTMNVADQDMYANVLPRGLDRPDYGIDSAIAGSAQRKIEAYEKSGTPYTMKSFGMGVNKFAYPVRDYGDISASLADLTNTNDNLIQSTDALNATMQSALSPYYSQDPRTTKLGFRAGVVGNQDWLTGATNANPLAAVLGAGATAPGMAGGGSFVVGGGYSANDNKMAVFPVASGEEVVVNRNKEATAGQQVVQIDNRIIINGSVTDDAISKMKVSRYQQAQRMRAGLAQAS